MLPPDRGKEVYSCETTASACPHRPVSRAVRDGVWHTSHIQAASPQLRQLLQDEEIVGVPTPAFAAVGHLDRSPHETSKRRRLPPTREGEQQRTRAPLTPLFLKTERPIARRPASNPIAKLQAAPVWFFGGGGEGVFITRALKL